MTKINSRVTKDTTKWNVKRNVANVPDIGGKMFRRTSENTSDIH